MAKIKKEKELKDGKLYYKVMLKAGFFSRWREEFGSYNEKQTNNIFRDISKAPNIEVKRNEYS